jgi:hypothetical protein
MGGFTGNGGTPGYLRVAHQHGPGVARFQLGGRESIGLFAPKSWIEVRVLGSVWSLLVPTVKDWTPVIPLRGKECSNAS